jgi:hypothetical protein
LSVDLAAPGVLTRRTNTLATRRNAAWYACLVQLGVTKEELWEDPSLTEVVANHIARGVLPANSLFYGQRVETLHRNSPNVARELRSASASGMVRLRRGE